jgi:hypothetical protein
MECRWRQRQSRPGRIEKFLRLRLGIQQIADPRPEHLVARAGALEKFPTLFRVSQLTGFVKQFLFALGAVGHDFCFHSLMRVTGSKPDIHAAKGIYWIQLCFRML